MSFTCGILLSKTNFLELSLCDAKKNQLYLYEISSRADIFKATIAIAAKKRKARFSLKPPLLPIEHIIIIVANSWCSRWDDCLGFDLLGSFNCVPATRCTSPGYYNLILASRRAARRQDGYTSHDALGISRTAFAVCRSRSTTDDPVD